MGKIDLTKTHRAYFSAKAIPHTVFLEKAIYISIRGKGDPSDKAFADKIGALYPVAYMVKFSCKDNGRDFVVSKLEGLWWYDEKKYPGYTIDTAVQIPRSAWEYRLLIRLPDFITAKNIREACEAVAVTKNLPLANQVEFFELTEGNCVQMLHVGPFSTEPVTLRAIDHYMKANNLKRNGLHHEIYLSDFRKTDAAKLKTILREPVQ